MSVNGIVLLSVRYVGISFIQHSLLNQRYKDYSLFFVYKTNSVIIIIIILKLT
jgi:hypothetical protein